MSSRERLSTDITTVFGRTLGAVRALAGYSQTELAELIPVDRSAIARFEIGRTTTSVPMLVAIERPLLAARALRRPGDLTLLTMRTVARLRAGGASVYLDRPPSGVPTVSVAGVVAAAETAVRAWADELTADGIVPGPPPGGEDPVADDPGRYEVARWMRDDEAADDGPADLKVSRKHLRSSTRREEDIAPKGSRFIRPTGRGPGEGG